MGARLEALDAQIFMALSVLPCIFYVPRLPTGMMWNWMQWFRFWKPPFQNGTKFGHAPLYCTGLSLGLSLTRLYVKVSVSVSVSTTSLSLSLGLEKTIFKVSVSVSVSKKQFSKSQSQSRSRKTNFQSLSISLSTRNPGLVDLCPLSSLAQPQ